MRYRTIEDRARSSRLRHETLNFWVTNKIPRRWLTHVFSRISRIESPRLTRVTIALWRWFAPELRLDEAKEQSFKSLHECFVRELRPGARLVDRNADILTSPCDAIVGACGPLDGIELLQAKDSPYRLDELLPDPSLVEAYRGGRYVTLRLTASMYHRFHAPYDCHLTTVHYIAGDVWNVNPPTLARVERLFCKNERAVLALHTALSPLPVTLVAVGAVLVASIRLHAIDPVLSQAYRGPNRIACNARYRKGDEMGYFQHGSTIIVFSSSEFSLAEGIDTGARIQMGQALLRR